MDSMSEFNGLFMTIVLVFFPILIYLVLCCYIGLKKQKYAKFLFMLTVITSLYLCMRSTGKIDNCNLILLFNIPVVLLYCKKQKKSALCLSLIIVIYAYMIDLNYILLLLKYILYYLGYLLINRFNKNDIILMSAVIQGFFLAFELFFNNPTIGYSVLIDLFLTMIIYYITTFLAVFLFKLADSVSTLYATVKELEGDKQIKNSLFKLTHEIKNPLAVCKGYLDMMDTMDTNKTERYINIIKGEIDRSLNIMTDFLEFNKIKIMKEEIDVYSLLEDVYEGFKILVESKNIKLIYDYGDEEVYMQADYNRLKQVLLNLLKNSKEAIEGNGIISIRGYYDKRHFYIEIKDNGVGMDEEALTKIKDMFYTTKSKGSGVGVSLSNEIIKAHSGKLVYESKVGIGTKAIITLPL